MTVSVNALQRLREAGVRPTVPRIAVLQVFDDLGDQPLSVEEVFRRISERGLRVSLGTVYRSVRQMEAQGVLQSAYPAGTKRLYRLQGAEPVAGETATPLWLVNRSNGERVQVSDSELLARLLMAAARSGLVLNGSRMAVEFDGTQ